MSAARNNGGTWVSIPRPVPGASLRLFCFPYAGAGSLIFRQWPEAIREECEVCLVELPGRNSRLREPAFRSMSPLAEAALEGLLPYLDRPFAFFGHSMGALLAFELGRLLRRRHLREPSVLFVSARSAPQIPETGTPMHTLNDLDFMQELHRLNGTPSEVLSNTELMEILLPVLRADFAACETYMYAPEPPLQCPITAFAGTDDHHVTMEMLRAWEQQSGSDFVLHLVEGDHFFLSSSRERLISLVNKGLEDIIHASV